MPALRVSRTLPPNDTWLQALAAPAQPPAVATAVGGARKRRFAQQTRQAVDIGIGDADETDGSRGAEQVPEWTEEDIVQLHWRLLLELRRLPDPRTPLEEKLDTLAWALTDPALDARPFSFANCLRVVGTSPLSPTAHFGAIDVELVRAWLRRHARGWIRDAIARYPWWVRTLIRQQPDHVARQLAHNPQWINEQIRARETTAQPELLAEARAVEQDAITA